MNPHCAVRVARAAHAGVHAPIPAMGIPATIHHARKHATVHALTRATIGHARGPHAADGRAACIHVSITTHASIRVNISIRVALRAIFTAD